ncbi:MAG TPA: orotidine-5'-phosphate decarboxylase, partial [Acidimicrobiales bacterium]|nr:orotidine-5'-phosphate decarboxylase [Acidimicrobiales bacterium]
MGDDLVREGFGARVAAAIDKTGPLCAGIDPSESLLRAWGLGDDAAGLREFGARCIDAFAGVVPVVKPQVAFFERFGAAGIAALETLIRDAQEAGLLVIADAKRGDIGSTMEAYASTWLDPRNPLCA